MYNMLNRALFKKKSNTEKILDLTTEMIQQRKTLASARACYLKELQRERQIRAKIVALIPNDMEA